MPKMSKVSKMPKIANSGIEEFRDLGIKRMRAS
jgi:hypothetical protein